jgi:hypothetical protein
MTVRTSLRAVPCLVLIGLLASFAQVGFASGTDPATTASWAKAANNVCAEENAQIRMLPRISSRNLISDLRATVRIASRADAELSAIPRPPTVNRSLKEMLSIIREQSALVTNQLLPALKRGDSAAYRRVGKTINGLNARYNALARSLGANVCAENPQPSHITTLA